MGLPAAASSQRACAWILPIPYEATTSYGAGTREGPSAIISASRQVEWYDRRVDAEACLCYGIRTLPPLALVHASPEKMVGTIAQAVAKILRNKIRPRILGILGGEHSISPGVAQGMARSLGAGDLVCVHIDAHADLRQEYEGSKYSHACAARRILEVCPVFQIGIRNLSAGEEKFRRTCRRLRTVFSDEANQSEAGFLDDLARFVRSKTVFLTIDLDGLDPGIMPSVGTPEPDGISWQRLLQIVDIVVRSCQALPVFDVVELAPIPGLRAPDFLAAKLIYHIFTAVLMPGAACARLPAGIR